MYKDQMNFMVLLILCFAPNMQAQFYTFPKENHVELGKVQWLRNYNEALIKAKVNNLPIFILFQEVPGCSNCTKFGTTILSDPLLVDIIETCFVPLCIYNNVQGHDKLILEQFNELAWNNPVVRIIDANGKDIVHRQADFKSKQKTLISISDALESRKVSIPIYFELLKDETAALESGIKDEVYMCMFCFWTGEKEIGKLDGILSTEAGYMHGKEVVKPALCIRKSITYRNAFKISRFTHFSSFTIVVTMIQSVKVLISLAFQP